MLENTLIICDSGIHELFYNNIDINELDYSYYSLDKNINHKKLITDLNRIGSNIDSVILCILDSSNKVMNGADNNKDDEKKVNIKENKSIGFKEGKYNNVINVILDKLRIRLNQKAKKNNNYNYQHTLKNKFIPGLGILIVSNEEFDLIERNQYLEYNIESSLPFLHNITELHGIDMVRSYTSLKELENRCNEIVTKNRFPWDYEIVMSEYGSAPTLRKPSKSSLSVVFSIVKYLLFILVGLVCIYQQLYNSEILNMYRMDIVNKDQYIKNQDQTIDKLNNDKQDLTDRIGICLSKLSKIRSYTLEE